MWLNCPSSICSNKSLPKHGWWLARNAWNPWKADCTNHKKRLFSTKKIIQLYNCFFSKSLSFQLTLFTEHLRLPPFPWWSSTSPVFPAPAATPTPAANQPLRPGGSLEDLTKLIDFPQLWDHPRDASGLFMFFFFGGGGFKGVQLFKTKQCDHWQCEHRTQPWNACRIPYYIWYVRVCVVDMYASVADALF